MKIVKISAALKDLKQINDEIRYASCVEEKSFTSGLIAFKRTKKSNVRQITHYDKDVVCHVLQGSGRLRVERHRFQLRPGTICHIPKGTPHDFAAGMSGELVLFYSLIKS
jgi:mannose-6-phosphate isomerase-like protein (cupin superfamily)